MDAAVDEFVTVSINDIAPGETKSVALGGEPIIIRHLTEHQLKVLRESPIRPFDDELSVDRRLLKFQNSERAINFVALNFLCPSSTAHQPALISKAEDDLYFCSYSTERFDLLGRSMGKGFGDKPSQFIPKYELISETQLKLWAR